MSLGKAHEKLGDAKAAQKHMRDALAIFRRTVGYDSPLTANAMGCLGKVRAALGDVKEAVALIKGALKLEIAKDAFHLETVWELFSKVKDIHMEESKQKTTSMEQAAKHTTHLQQLQMTYSQYLPLIAACRKRITPAHERDELGTLAVLYKTVGEIQLLAQDYKGGESVLNDAVRCLKKVADFDCSSLIEGCEMLLNIAASNQKAGVPSKDYANKAPAAAASSSSSAAGPSSGSG